MVSFYGYGFLVKDWFNTPSKFYLKYPGVKEEDVKSAIEDFPIGNGDIFKRFLIYIYGRQSGRWLEMISGENEEEFLNKYSLKNIKKQVPKAFFAYSFNDTDVPFLESIKLQNVFPKSETFSTSLDAHDFDRDEKSHVTRELLMKMLEFLDSSL